MIRQDEVFFHEDFERIWKKFCGFLDLSIEEYLGIQESLLMHQIEMVYQSPLGKKFIPYKPKSVADFRRIIPFTTYKNYTHYLDRQSTSFLPDQHYQWACAENRSGGLKWIPFTQEALLAISRCLICTLILACAEKKGDVKIMRGSRILHNLHPSSYTTTLYASVVAKQTGMKFFPNHTESKLSQYSGLTERELMQYLNSRVDVIALPGNMLYKIGEKWANSQGHLNFSFHMLSPEYIWRFILAEARSLKEHRNLLPKDIWSIKGLISSGAEANIFQDKIFEYWGKKPLMIYQTPEAGIIATQVWNKDNYTFLPASSFHEFMPEEEVLRNRENPEYLPRTVLLNQVKTGKKYEPVISSFYGMPFLRYRTGDLILITALEDRETGIQLPQMTVESRSDEVITIGDFFRLDEKQLLQAIVRTGLKYEDWCVHTGEEIDQPLLTIYIELKDNKDKRDLEGTLDMALIEISEEYKKNRLKRGSSILKVVELPKGSFNTIKEHYRQEGSTLQGQSSKNRYISTSDVEQFENVIGVKKYSK